MEVSVEGRLGHRKNLILAILSRSEVSCSSASYISVFSVIQAAIFLSRSCKISFFRCSCCKVLASKIASSSFNGVAGSPSSISVMLARVFERCDRYPCN